MKVKTVFRWSPQERIYRLCRIIWRRGEGPGVGGENYDAELSFALCLNLFRFKRELHGWILRLCGIRIHYERSYGGVIV